MSDFRQLTEHFWASPQIDLDDVAEAARQGFALIVNNRPEGEAPDQVPGHAIERAAQSAGIAYQAIPVTHAGFSEEQVRAMAAAIAKAEGPVLAYCRSGRRRNPSRAAAARKRRSKQANVPTSDASISAADRPGRNSSFIHCSGVVQLRVATSSLSIAV